MQNNALPNHKIKGKPKRKTMSMWHTSLSFKDYIQNTSNNLYYKYPCTNKLYHLFFYQTEYCIDCLEYLCQWCKNQHNKTCKNHLFLPFLSMSVIHKDSTKEHKYHSLNDMQWSKRNNIQTFMKDYSIKHYYKTSTFQSPLIISFYHKPNILSFSPLQRFMEIKALH